MKKLLLFLLCFALVLPFAACEDKRVDGENSQNTEMGTKIVYVPLDNRPVNFDRVGFLAQATGMEVLMPNEEWLSTTLGENYDQGNPKEIFNWLKEQEGDYYVISLDMLFSGGLVGSRAAFDDKDDSIGNMDAELGEYTLSPTEQEIVDYIINLSQTKHVVLLDTVMRLASTANYGGWDMQLYNFLRNDFAAVERDILTGGLLTIENIVAGYKYDKNGKEISVKQGSTDRSEIINEYLKSRERKLYIADAIYNKCGNNVSLFIGVDDSSPKPTIQTNEIRYITDILTYQLDNALLFAGADELGLMGISEVVTSKYGEINVNLRYFGEGKDYVADDYDPGILSDSIVSHIDAVGGKIVNNDDSDLDVLVLTRSAASGTNVKIHEANVKDLVEELKYNLKNNIPTCVIDASGYGGYGTLAKAMLDAELDIAEILGFSAWNTVGNSIGISLSNAVARYSYLKNSESVTEESHQGFMKTVAFSHVKDTAYKKFGNLPHPDQAKYDENYDLFVACSESIVERINESGIFISATTVEDKYDVSVSNLDWPWDRNFEAIFDISVNENGNSSVFE